MLLSWATLVPMRATAILYLESILDERNPLLSLFLFPGNMITDRNSASQLWESAKCGLDLSACSSQSSSLCAEQCAVPHVASFRQLALTNVSWAGSHYSMEVSLWCLVYFSHTTSTLRVVQHVWSCDLVASAVQTSPSSKHVSLYSITILVKSF